MAAAVRPCADWLRGHADRLSVSQPRRDVVLLLPFQSWVNTKECRATFLARELRKRNLQFEVAQEQGVGSVLAGARVLVVENAETVPSGMKDTLRMFAHRGGTLILAACGKRPAALGPPFRGVAASSRPGDVLNAGAIAQTPEHPPVRSREPPP